MPSTKTDHSVSYDLVMQLLREIGPLVRNSHRNDYRRMVGAFIAEHDPDLKVRSLIKFSMMEERQTIPTPIGETPKQRRDRATQEIYLRWRLASDAKLGLEMPAEITEYIICHGRLPLTAEQLEAAEAERIERFNRHRADFE